MSYAFSRIKGLTFYDSRRACVGFTLLSPVEGNGLYLIDMKGRFVNYWEMGYKPGTYGEILPNGHLLYEGKLEDEPLADMEGAGGILIETDWDGKVVWKYEDPNLHHAFCRMDSGNTLVLKRVKVPENIAVRVQGGIPGTERRGIMWGDAIQEISPKGKVVWEWVAHEHLDPAKDAICVLCPRSMWTRSNSVTVLPDGNISAILAGIHTMVMIDKKTGNITWKWGRNEVGHPHSVSMLDNGHLLFFDNGLHPSGAGCGYSRLVEIDPKTSKLVWSYGRLMDEHQVFFSATMSNCQRLPNGNTLVCEGNKGRIFELYLNDELAWEYISGFPAYETTPTKSTYTPVYAAFRYDLDYSGLKRPRPYPVAKQTVPGKTAVPKVAAAQSRLEWLGY